MLITPHVVSTIREAVAEASNKMIEAAEIDFQLKTDYILSTVPDANPLLGVKKTPAAAKLRASEKPDP